MLRVVADVGGTNTRVAVVDPSTSRPGASTAYQNDDFPGIESALDAFVSATGDAEISDIVITVAGPVIGPTARLTNRDWHFDRDALSRHLNGANVVLINDMTAFGLALRHLDAAAVETINPGQGGSRNGQRLVINIGTGFNVSPVSGDGAATVCMQSEIGHAGLPGAVCAVLREMVGGDADGFLCIEDLFSGRGLPRFMSAYLGRRGVAADVVARAKDELRSGGEARGEASGGVAAYAELVATLARDLAFAYMPLDGVYFTGGVARIALKAAYRPRFIKRFRMPFPVVADLAAVPVSLIVDDAAALYGCAHALSTRAAA